MTGFAVVSTTVADATRAEEIARTLVADRLAACVQILPVRSVYRWHGAVEATGEHLLLCKIAEGDFAAVEQAIRAKHDYEVPEIVMTPLTGIGAAYAAWLGAETTR